MSKLYEFKDYDRHLSLRFNLEMWLVILYLLRPYIILLSMFRRGRGGASNVAGLDTIKNMVYPDDFSLALGVAATIPALLIIIAVMKKKPSSGNFIRWVWHNGKLLLSIAAVLNILIIFVPVISGALPGVLLSGWAQVAISVYILGYLQTSRRVRDTFADFPKDEGAAS